MASPSSTSRWLLHVRQALQVAALCGTATAANAQVFPPPAVESATTVEAALAALGAGKPTASTRLLLDLPDVAVAGRVHARLASELPGTAAFVLLRGEAAQPNVANAPAPAMPVAAKPSPVLVKAHKFPAGESPQLEFDFDLEGATQSYTLVAYAQGRWFSTTRQIKVGSAKRSASAPPKKR